MAIQDKDELEREEKNQGKVCPACGHVNIAGVDMCSNCYTDLFHLDSEIKPRTDDKFEQSILTDRIFEMKLRRAYLVESSTPVREVIRILVEKRRGAVFVVEDLDKSNTISSPKEIVGEFRAWEVVSKIFPQDPWPLDEPVKNYMRPIGVVLNINDTVVKAIHILMTEEYEYLPVYIEGLKVKYIGIKDIIDYIMEKNPRVSRMQEDGELKYLKRK